MPADEVVTYDDLGWQTPVHYDRTRVRKLFRLDWLAAQEIFCGPVGVGKSWERAREGTTLEKLHFGSARRVTEPEVGSDTRLLVL